MGESSASNDPAKTRALLVWDRLLGCFGDAVLRKFGPEPPDEWSMALSYLNESQINRAFRRLIAAGATAPPTLPHFMKLARALTDENEADPIPTPRALEDHSTMDRWELMANQWLLVHIRNQIAKDSRHYGTPGSAEMEILVGRLVEAKKNWTADMQDLCGNDHLGRVPMAQAKAIWDDYLSRAEAPSAGPAPGQSVAVPSGATPGPLGNADPW